MASSRVVRVIRSSSRAPSESIEPTFRARISRVHVLRNPFCQARTGPHATPTEREPSSNSPIGLATSIRVRDGADLVGMAGERLHPPGFTEISAVCTDASHRGQGLASRLVRAIVEGIWARGEKPFLHLTLENEPAHRIYAALGFDTRSYADVVGLRAPV